MYKKIMCHKKLKYNKWIIPEIPHKIRNLMYKMINRHLKLI